MEGDYHNVGMLVSCYAALDDETNRRRVAKITLERAERALALDPTNASAAAHGAPSLAIFGERERAREWIQRALVLDPDSLGLRYNLACALAMDLGDGKAALDVLAPFFDRIDSPMHIKHLEADPDFGSIRDEPRFQNMLASAKRRLGMSAQAE